MIKNKFRSGFTIVELIVVISVIGILAGIVLVSYGAWRTSVATASLKSDLTHAASAMESNRSFTNSYSLTIPSSFSVSAGNNLTLTTDTKSFCIDGTTTQSASINYYIDNLTQSNGATSGTCIARIPLSLPLAVSNVSFTVGSTAIVVNWTLASPNNASQYLVQCAVDPGFITGLIQQTTTGGPTTVQQSLSGSNSTTTYYCRVRATNANGVSAWSTAG